MKAEYFTVLLCRFVKEQGRVSMGRITSHFYEREKNNVIATVSTLCQQGCLLAIENIGQKPHSYEYVRMPGSDRPITPKQPKPSKGSGVVAAYRSPPTFTPRTADPFEAWRMCMRDTYETSNAAVHSYKVG